MCSITRNILLMLVATAAVAGEADFFASQPYDDQIIYVIRTRKNEQAMTATTAVAPVAVAETPAPSMTKRDGMYDRFWNDPEQFYVDSPDGPMPLWGHDLVYDKDGKPVPRYPDPFTKRLVEHPDDDDAYRQYLAFKTVQARRAQVLGEKLAPKAAEFGMLDKDVLRVEPGERKGSMEVGKTDGIDPESLGTPALSTEQASKLGYKPKQVPRTPGEANQIEVIWIWNYDCSVCESMARDWFYFARDVNQAGYKAVSVSLNDDTGEVAARLNYWGIRWPVRDSLNLSDWTHLQESLNITATPTFFLVNRRTGTMMREEGYRNEEQLRTMFRTVAGMGPGAWPPEQNAKAKAIGKALAMEEEAAQATHAAPARVPQAVPQDAPAGTPATAAPGTTTTPAKPVTTPWSPKKQDSNLRGEP